MHRISTFNVNGIRAAERRRFAAWLESADLDVVALQEVRCPPEKLPEVFAGWHLAYDPGTLAGRNGVAVLTRSAPAAIRTWGAPALIRSPGQSHTSLSPAASHPRGLARGLAPFTSEGRFIEVDLTETAVTVASLYLPKGGLPAELQNPARMRDKPDGGAKYERKMGFMRAFSRQLTAMRRHAAAQGREFLLMGDLNIAHTRLDVANWRSNQKTDGFLPEERQWLSDQLSPRTLVDVVRSISGEVSGPYSWWSWMGQAHANDTGWRIDYHLASPRLARSAGNIRIDSVNSGGGRMSDHAAVTVDYSL